MDAKEKKWLIDARTFLKQINNRLPCEISAQELGGQPRLPFKVLTLMSTLIYRVSDLAETAINLFESRRTVAAIIITRSIFESTTILYRLNKKTNNILSTKKLGNIDEFLMKSIFGGKDGKSPVDAYNILTAIEQMDKELTSWYNSYRSLSNYAHPNWPGLMGSYGELDKEKMILYLGRQTKTSNSLVGLPLLAMSLRVSIHYYDKIKESLGEFIKICEEADVNSHNDQA